MARSVALSLCFCVSLLLAASSVEANALSDFWENLTGDIKNAFDTAVNKTKDAYNFVECKTVDKLAFDMQPCWDAPSDNLCTPSCKQELGVLPQTCLDRIMSEIVSVDNANITARIDDQLKACGLTYTTVSGVLGSFGNILVPLAVLAASMALMELLHF